MGNSTRIAKKTAVIAAAAALLLGLPVPSPAQAAESMEWKIEDPVLEQAIRDELKITDRALQKEDAFKLKSLYPQGEGKIASLAGLEWATNLEGLYLPGQYITDITPLQSLYQLDFLALNGNRITNICPAAGLYNLSKLVISGNEITDIGCLSRLEGLTDLLADSNRITDVSGLADMKLRWLNLENNRLTDITPLEFMGSLTHLYVGGNALNDRSLALLESFRQSGIAVDAPGSGQTSASVISVLLDDERVFFEKAPVLESGTTLVQFRPLFEKLGFTVEWEAGTQTVRAEKPGVKLSLQVGNRQAVLNGTPTLLQEAPQNREGNVMIPLRFVGEATGYSVSWDGESKTVRLQKPYWAVSDGGGSQVYVDGDWQDLTRMDNQFDLYLVKGNQFLLLLSEEKEGEDGVVPFDRYEQQMRKALADAGLDTSEAAAPFKLGGLQARQLEYTAKNQNTQAEYNVQLTLIEGESRYYRLLMAVPADSSKGVSDEFEKIVQSFQEVKSSEELFQEKFGTFSPEERVADAAKYYRAMGFFASMTEQQLAEKFRDFHKNFGEEQDWNPYYPKSVNGMQGDLYLLGEDAGRVWLEDTEADVGKGNDVYVQALQRWREISRGAFQPTDIVESWGSEEGPVTVSFTLNGERKTVYPLFYNDFMDIEIIRELNRMIRDTGYQFAVYEIDQTVFVTVLTPDEQRKMEAERFLELTGV
ncbi:stalk domain-containing protein [Paenibacillus sp. S-38]|uniref:stalk domain-containing protein n=1 Tax=Paenibacillus sp. S-38 TaxID=3416710 RepID=UPI003CEBDC70